jgi:hypothetical protein
MQPTALKLLFGENNMVKKSIFIGVAILLIICFIFFDYYSKKEAFLVKRNELVNREMEFGVVSSKINGYFFENGWFPDSLGQADTLFARTSTEYNLKGTLNGFCIDPFSDKFYHYIPIVNKRYGRPEGYYLLSAGIDSKIDNDGSEDGKLKLYDSLYFNYLDVYFGRKDLLVKEETIVDWINSPAWEMSLREILKGYNPDRRRDIAHHMLIDFDAVVDSVYTDRFTVKDPQGKIKADCHLAPFPNQKEVVPGEQVKIRGIYNKITFEPDTVLNFLNCVVLEK